MKSDHKHIRDVQTRYRFVKATLSPCRLDLLRYVRQHGAGNVRELARALSPDAQLAIDLLQERRTALISAATGQINVRDAVNSL